MPDIRVEDQQGTVHVFPDGSTPKMIAQALGVKPPTAEANSVAALPNAAMQSRNQLLASQSGLTRDLGLYPTTLTAAKDEEAARLKSMLSGVSGLPDISRVTPEQAKTGMAVGALAGGLLTAPAATVGGVVGGAAGNEAFRSGAKALGASPEKADMWGTAGGIAGGLAGGEAGGRFGSWLKTLPPGAQQIWNKITGYSKAVEEAKNTNTATYLASEQKGQEAVAAAQEKVATAKAAEPQGEAGEWAKLNQAVGTTAKAIRIGRGATDLSKAYGVPGRGLAIEGFDSATLAKMTPPEQAAAIAPKWQAAGKAVSDTVQKATDDGKILDVGSSAFKVFKDRIPNPKLQEQAIEIFNEHTRNLGIANVRQATPAQALQLRQALKSDARFGPVGDFSTIKGIGAGLYRAVSEDLHNAVPGLREVDLHYGDLTEAVSAIQKQVGRYLTGQWKPPLTAVQKAEIKVPEMPNVSPYKPLPSSKAYTLDILKKAGGAAGFGGGAISGAYYGGKKLAGMMSEMMP